MKKISLLLSLTTASLAGFAQTNDYPSTGNPTIYGYSPLINLKRISSEGGYIQGIQTLLQNGTPHWFFGNQHDDGPWVVSKGDYSNPKFAVLSNGNVGVGTIIPASRLHIQADANTSGAPANAQLFISGATSPEKRLSLGYNTSSNYGEIQAQMYNGSYAPMALNPNGGSIGIGTTTPTEKLSVYGTVNSTPGIISLESSRNDAMDVEVGAIKGKNDYVEVAKIGMLRGSGTHTGFLNFSVRPTNEGTLTEAMRIAENGNVLIGKTSQSNTAYKFDVNGKVRANEIVVNTSGADFVFEDNYKLKPLAEVEQFIKQHKHLPEIASAQTMQNEGVGISELQTKLLQKIEELTLHLIEKDKELNKEKELNRTQSERLKLVETKQSELEALLKKLIVNK